MDGAVGSNEVCAEDRPGGHVAALREVSKTDAAVVVSERASDGAGGV